LNKKRIKKTKMDKDIDFDDDAGLKSNRRVI
jgi:hypothetical protein